MRTTNEEKIWSRSILGVDRAELVRILELGIRAGRFCHIAHTKGHGVMSDKALPLLRADTDKVDSEAVKFWFWLASAAAKRNLKDRYPKASTEKHTVSKPAWGR